MRASSLQAGDYSPLRVAGFFSLVYFWVGLKLTVQWSQGEILLDPCLEQRFSDAMIRKYCHQQQYFWKSHHCIRGYLPKYFQEHFEILLSSVILKTPWQGTASLQPVAESQMEKAQGTAGGEGYRGKGRISLLDMARQPAAAFVGASPHAVRPRQVPGSAAGAQL